MVDKGANGPEVLDFLRQQMAGAAHDLNNLLVLVNGCAELALQDDALSAPTRQLMNEILDTGERAKSLARQMLALGQPLLRQPTAVDVAALLAASARLLDRLTGERIRLDLDVAAEPIWVLAQASQLEQVIVNLVLNARDAMPGGGTLAIAAATAPRRAAHETAAGVSQGDCVARLVVTDTGSGIDPAILERMYEPYVTTKSGDKGSGLGLAVVRSIVDQLGGSIDVATAAGRGTTFAIELPLSGPPLSADGDRRSAASEGRADDDGARQRMAADPF